jgi:hypothetical protein
MITTEAGSSTGSEASTGSQTSTSTVGSSDEGTSTGDVDCSEFVGVLSAEEAQLSPRPGGYTAELWGLQFTNGAVVSDELYARVVSDLQEIDVSGCLVDFYDPNILELSVNRDTRDAILDGVYHAWDCANERYGAEEATIFGQYAWIRWSGLYDTRQIAEDYLSLPGVVNYVPGLPPDCGELNPGPGSSRKGCADGETFYYHRWTGNIDGELYASEPGQPPDLLCAWVEGEQPCPVAGLLLHRVSDP